VVLAAAVDVEKVEAEYRNGFLWVHLPKARPQHVTINTDPGES
jgi:HSP20 family molecular chaperone IbpA